MYDTVKSRNILSRRDEDKNLHILLVEMVTKVSVSIPTGRENLMLKTIKKAQSTAVVHINHKDQE
jgi:hypothetical protein